MSALMNTEMNDLHGRIQSLKKRKKEKASDGSVKPISAEDQKELKDKEAEWWFCQKYFRWPCFESCF